MKTNCAFLITMALTIILGVTNASCNVNLGEQITPSDNYITRDYKVGSFDRINISTVADVYFIQSTDGTTSAQAYGPDNIVELIQVRIENNTLIMSMEKKKRFNNAKKMKITITTPELYEIDFKGIGNLIVENGLNTSKLDIDCSGVGDINIKQLACEGDLSVYSKGVGNVKLYGKAQNATLSSKGVGNIDADELICTSVDASSEGVGNISCFASQSINASVRGVGNISYKGNPAEKRINKSGIGSIKEN